MKFEMCGKPLRMLGKPQLVLVLLKMALTPNISSSAVFSNYSPLIGTETLLQASAQIRILFNQSCHLNFFILKLQDL